MIVDQGSRLPDLEFLLFCEITALHTVLVIQAVP